MREHSCKLLNYLPKYEYIIIALSIRMEGKKDKNRSCLDLYPHDL